jgi:UDP-N-acetylglucosamine transferase subunit ALG13
MILVTVGTNEAPFDRLLLALGGRQPVDGEQLVVQHGPSSVRPPGAECVDYLPYDELADAIRRARVVVTHAGVGSIMTSLSNGRRPIVVPRLARYGEAVDDHQIGLGRRLAAEGLVTCAETEEAIREALDAPPPAAEVELGASTRLVADLKAYVESRRR